MDTSNVILSVKNLYIGFPSYEGFEYAVDGISFDVSSGETLGLVGESGCGKSVTCMTIMGLLGERSGLPGAVSHVEGSITYRGRELTNLTPNQMNKIRGDRITMIFQDPQGSLNPIKRIGWQLAEVMQLHRKDLDPSKYEDLSVKLLDEVGISDSRARLRQFPHEFSGGMLQRVGIAMALATEPDLLIADEPTTALDVTVQAQVLRLLRELQQQRQMSMILVSHDLGVVRHFADTIAVMYNGHIVELGPVVSVLKNSKHPYTDGLVKAMPTLDVTKGKVKPIPGTVPALGERPVGCPFEPRCSYAIAQCKSERPQITNEEHSVACFLPLTGKLYDKSHSALRS